MTNSTLRPTEWSNIGGELTISEVRADVAVAVENSAHTEEYVTIVRPDDLELMRPIRLRVERDEGGFVVSDDFSDVYGAADTHQAAIADYRAALAGLERVLSAREERLSPELRHRLAIIRSVIPRS
jgi:hypothetical protein